MQLLHKHLSFNPQFLRTYACTLMREEKYESAKAIWKELLQKQPSYDAWLQLGICFEKKANYEKAISCWSIASAMIPSRFRPDYLSIQTYLKQNDTIKAKQLMQVFFAKKKKVDSPVVDRMRDNIRLLSDGLSSR
jgi:O-antigen polymerase